MKTCVIIPVYNNIGTVKDVVQRCRAVMEPDILVVSDGSTDGSDAEARETGVKVAALKKNQGKGSAILHGLREADRFGYTHAIVLDADGQHYPEEIPSFYAAAENHPDKFWVGVRRFNDQDIPDSTIRGRTISNFWTTVAGWQRCKDAQCGFRVYPIKETLALGCKEAGFQFEMEVLVRAAWAGMDVAHHDVDVHYPKEGRVSHFDMKSDNIKFTWLSIRLFFGMLPRIPMLAYRKLKIL